MLRKIVITLLTGGAAYFLTNLSGQDQVWSLSASIFIGGVTLVVQFLHDFEQRLGNVEERQSAHSAEMRTLVEEGFAKTSEATELLQAVESSALQTDAVTQLVWHSTRIGSESPPLVRRFAQLQINRMSQFLKEFSGVADVSYDGEDRDWLLGLTTQSELSLVAISLSTVDAGGESFDGGFWMSDFGLRYLEHQREAVRRGVAVRRIFIADRPEQSNETGLQLICRQQKNLGIQVRVLNRSDISHDLLFDFVVFDEAIGYQVTPASRVEVSMMPTIVNTHLVLQPERVSERVRRFEDLWSTGQDFE